MAFLLCMPVSCLSNHDRVAVILRQFHREEIPGWGQVSLFTSITPVVLRPDLFPGERLLSIILPRSFLFSPLRGDPLLCGLCRPSALYTILFLRQLDRPRPLPLGQRHFLKPAVRSLKLTNHIDLHNKGVCLVRRATEPVPAGGSGFILTPSILDHASISYSHLSQV